MRDRGTGRRRGRSTPRGSYSSLHHADVAVAQLLARHLQRDDVGAELGLVGPVEPALFGQPGVQRRLGNGVQHADHRVRRSGPRSRNSTCASKIVGVVVVEADDHPAPDLEPGLLDALDLVEDACPLLADVLELLRLAQRLLVRALDADEDATDVGLDHQLHQLVVLGQVERRLGEEAQRIAVLPPARRRRRAAAALTAFLLPIRLSSTMNARSRPLCAQWRRARR